MRLYLLVLSLLSIGWLPMACLGLAPRPLPAEPTETPAAFTPVLRRGPPPPTGVAAEAWAAQVAADALRGWTPAVQEIPTDPDKIDVRSENGWWRVEFRDVVIRCSPTPVPPYPASKSLCFDADYRLGPMFACFAPTTWEAYQMGTGPFPGVHYSECSTQGPP